MKKIPKITPQTRITLYPLAARKENDLYIVGRIETGTFISLPETGMQVTQLLQKGKSLGTISNIIEKEHDAEIDIEDFIIQLQELGFTSAINGIPLDKTGSKPHKFYENIPTQFCWMIILPFIISDCILLSTALVTIFQHPSVIPTYTDFFWTSSTTTIILTNTLLSLLFVMLHELMHFLTARLFGIPARFSLGTRLQSLAAQTDVSAAWILPKKQRCVIYLAGIGLNIAIIALSVIILTYLSIPLVIIHLLRVVILLNALIIITEFYIYMRTDMYFVVMTLLGAYNLYPDAMNYFQYLLQQVLHAIRGRSLPIANPIRTFPMKEQRIIRWYMVFAITSSAIALLVFAMYGIPIAVRTYLRALLAISNGIQTRNGLHLLDGVVTLAIEGGFLLVFLITFYKRHTPFLIEVKKRIKDLFILTRQFHS